MCVRAVRAAEPPPLLQRLTEAAGPSSGRCCTCVWCCWVACVRWFQYRSNFSIEESIWTAGRQMDVFFCTLWQAVYPPSLLLLLLCSLSWRLSYVRGESLPTAHLCFCFSQWANASLLRPHSLSSRPLSWKYSRAEATGGQAREAGEEGEAKRGLFQQMTWL